MITVYRRNAGPFLLAALAVFLPLQFARYPLIGARWFPVAIALTFLGHVALVAVLRRLLRRDREEVPRIGLPAAALGLVGVLAFEIVGGLAVEAVVGRSTFGITLGGFLPSVLLGPLWALVVLGALEKRRRQEPVSR